MTEDQAWPTPRDLTRGKKKPGRLSGAAKMGMKVGSLTNPKDAKANLRGEGSGL